MKHQINEIKRMQQLAGLINENKEEDSTYGGTPTMRGIRNELSNTYGIDLDAPGATYSSDSGYEEWDSLEELLSSISDYVNTENNDRAPAKIYKVDMQWLNGTSSPYIKLNLKTGMSYKATISWAKMANDVFQGTDYIEIYQ